MATPRDGLTCRQGVPGNIAPRRRDDGPEADAGTGAETHPELASILAKTGAGSVVL